MKKSSEQWLGEVNNRGAKLMVYDPDGWDRRNYDHSWNEEINVHEFFKRLNESTISLKAGVFKLSEIETQMIEEFSNGE